MPATSRFGEPPASSSTSRSVLDERSRSPAPYGVGHTRWATHGVPNEENAHPHRDNGPASIVVVHNGIIENYLRLQERLGLPATSFVDRHRHRDDCPNLLT